MLHSGFCDPIESLSMRQISCWLGERLEPATQCRVAGHKAKTDPEKSHSAIVAGQLHVDYLTVEANNIGIDTNQKAF